MFLYFVN